MKPISWSWGERRKSWNCWGSEPGRPGIHESCVLTCLSLRFHWDGIFPLTLELLPIDSTIKIGDHFVSFPPSICLIGMTPIHTTKLWVSSSPPFNYPLCLRLLSLQDVHKPKSRDRERAWILGRVLVGKSLYVWSGCERAELNNYKMLELRWLLGYPMMYCCMYLLL